MTTKERVKQTLNHQQPNHLVVDFGATPTTGIHVLAVEKLRKYFGLESKPVKVIEPFQMLGEIDNELIEAMDIDVIGLYGRYNMFGIPQENFKEFKTFWGQTVLIPGEFNTSIDSNGDLLIYPEGDMSVSASAKMPETGYFFDAIIRQQPFDDEHLNVEDNLEEFGLISEIDLKHWKKLIDQHAHTDKGIIATFGGTALGDIALVPGLNLKHPRGIRDVAEWYMSTLMRADYLHMIFEKQTDIAVENLKKIFTVAGNRIDAVFVCGTDFGTQNSTFCSPDTFNELYLPYYKKVNDWIHKNTTWKIFKHSCGAIVPLMENFIHAGFDIINPVQVSADGMESKMLKEKFGDRLTFWGGGVDTQKVLAFGTPKDIEKQVLEQCNVFSKNGGFIFNTVHNVQANVPIENLVAMIKAYQKFKKG